VKNTNLLASTAELIAAIYLWGSGLTYARVVFGGIITQLTGTVADAGKAAVGVATSLDVMQTYEVVGFVTSTLPLFISVSRNVIAALDVAEANAYVGATVAICICIVTP